jgi:hypothetical protein
VTFKPGEGAWTALGLEVDSDESLPGAALSRGSDRFVVNELEAELSLDGAQPAQKLSFILATTNAYPGVDRICDLSGSRNCRRTRRVFCAHHRCILIAVNVLEPGGFGARRAFLGR